jgi:hypothetical protein
MVILIHTDKGRFGHKLSQFVTLLAYAVKYRKPFYYRGFYDFFGHFLDWGLMEQYTPSGPSKKISIYSRLYLMGSRFFTSKKKLGDALFYYYPRSPRKLVFSDTLNEMFASGTPLIFTDRMFNDIPVLLEYRAQVRELFRFQPSLDKKIKDHIAQLRQTYDHIVCLHIRKREYRVWAEGKFYFTDEQYAGLLRRFIAVSGFDPGKTVAIICSDEEVDVKEFDGLNIEYSERPYEEDFLLLLNSDFILAARSIFSTMANYLGDNRLYQVSDADAEFTLKDFMQSPGFLQRFDKGDLIDAITIPFEDAMSTLSKDMLSKDFSKRR